MKKKQSQYLLTVTEVADRLSLKEETIREYLRNNELKGAKFGTRWRVRESDLCEFIEEHLNS